MAPKVPSDYATNSNCFMKVTGNLYRDTSNTPVGDIDHVSFKLLDQQAFATLTVDTAKQQKLKQQEQSKPDTRTGPPM